MYFNLKQLLLIYNPVSGSGNFKNKLDWFIKAFQARNIILLPYRTLGKDRDDFASLLVNTDYDGILVAGGDGSLHNVINAAMKVTIEAPIGIIGGGTSNDFATHIGVPTNLELYLDSIAAGNTQKIDLGRVGDKYFVNVASAGLLTGIAHGVTPQLKNSFGKLAYYAKGIGELPKLNTFSLKVFADGKKHILDVFLFVIANSPVVAGMKHIGDNIRIDDGKLDLIAIKKSSLPQLMAVVTDLFANRPITQRHNIIHIAATHFDITTDMTMLSDLDGELGPLLPLSVSTVPKALDFYTIPSL